MNGFTACACGYSAVGFQSCLTNQLPHRFRTAQENMELALEHNPEVFAQVSRACCMLGRWQCSTTFQTIVLCIICLISRHAARCSASRMQPLLWSATFGVMMPTAGECQQIADLAALLSDAYPAKLRIEILINWSCGPIRLRCCTWIWRSTVCRSKPLWIAGRRWGKQL